MAPENHNNYIEENNISSPDHSSRMENDSGDDEDSIETSDGFMDDISSVGTISVENGMVIENNMFPAAERSMPVLAKSNDVCFKASKHKGTIEWRNAVRKFSDMYDLYPKWNDEICDTVREELARHNIKCFLVSLDSQGNPSKTIKDGNWYEATDEEILTKTKQRFDDDRKQQRQAIAKNKPKRPVGRPKKQPTAELPNSSMMGDAHLSSMYQFQWHLLELFNLRQSLDEELRRQPTNDETINWLATTKVFLEQLHGFVFSQFQYHPAAFQHFHPSSHFSTNVPKQISMHQHPSENFFRPTNPFDDPDRQVTVVHVNTSGSVPTPEPTASSCSSKQKTTLLAPQPPSDESEDEAMVTGRPNSVGILRESVGIARPEKSVAAQYLEITPDAPQSAALPIQSAAVQTVEATPDVLHSTSLSTQSTPTAQPSDAFVPDVTNSFHLGAVIENLAVIAGELLTDGTVVSDVDDTVVSITRQEEEERRAVQCLREHTMSTTSTDSASANESVSALEHGTQSKPVPETVYSASSAVASSHTEVTPPRSQEEEEERQAVNGLLKQTMSTNTSTDSPGANESVSAHEQGTRSKPVPETVYSASSPVTSSRNEVTPPRSQRQEEEEERQAVHRLLKQTMSTNTSTDSPGANESVSAHEQGTRSKPVPETVYSASSPVTSSHNEVTPPRSQRHEGEERQAVHRLLEQTMSTNTSTDSASANDSVSAQEQGTRSVLVPEAVYSASSSVTASHNEVPAPPRSSQALLERSVGAAAGSTTVPSVASANNNPRTDPYLLNRLLSELKTANDCCQVVSRKVNGDEDWVELFASLNAEDFGRIIASIRTDSDRLSVAELVAPLIQGFTCQHVTRAVQETTSFHVTLAKNLIPLCTDKSSNLPIILNQLDEWDMNLLSIGLNQKLRMVQ